MPIGRFPFTDLPAGDQVSYQVPIMQLFSSGTDCGCWTNSLFGVVLATVVANDGGVESASRERLREVDAVRGLPCAHGLPKAS